MNDQTGKYWANGITVTYLQPYGERPGAWKADLDFFSGSGFQRVSTEGEIRTNFVQDAASHFSLPQCIDALLGCARDLGIRVFDPAGRHVSLYYAGDGESEQFPPPDGWRDLLREQAQRLGWATYGYTPTEYYWVVWTKNRREIVSAASGHDLVDEDAALRQVTTKPYDFEHTKANSWLERVDEERFDALGDWDALTEGEKQALRPVGAAR